MIAINAATSPAVTFPQNSSGRELTFRTHNFLFTEKKRYYVLFDPGGCCICVLVVTHFAWIRHVLTGVAVGPELCGPESPAIRDPNLWVVTVGEFVGHLLSCTTTIKVGHLCTYFIHSSTSRCNSGYHVNILVCLLLFHLFQICLLLFRLLNVFTSICFYLQHCYDLPRSCMPLLKFWGYSFKEHPLDIIWCTNT